MYALYLKSHSLYKCALMLCKIFEEEPKTTSMQIFFPSISDTSLFRMNTQYIIFSHYISHITCIDISFKIMLAKSNIEMSMKKALT